jgi:hypothetical protein
VSASVPIGIIPAGSDNSLVWTVLGVKDPISAALSIVRVKNTLFYQLYFSLIYVFRSFYLHIICCHCILKDPKMLLSCWLRYLWFLGGVWDCSAPVFPAPLQLHGAKHI